MRKKISLGAVIAFTIVVISITASITMVFSQNYFNTMVFNVKEREKMYNALSDIDSEIRQKYYGEITESKIQENVARGYVAGLGDPYSRYLSKNEYELKLQDNAGERVGIGIGVIANETGYYQISKIYNNSAAMVAGILENDVIIAIDGVDAKINSTESITNKLLGKVGTNVNLTIQRENEKLEFKLKRKQYLIESVTYKKLDDGNGYIKITEFNTNTAVQFSNAVDDLIKQGADGLIFDLRNNGGGVLSSCYKMLDKLVTKGTLAYGINNKGEETVLAKSDDLEVELPMTVLVNNKTASASELFTAVLIDFKKIPIIGTQSYGKGVMQTLIPLNDGSAINITTGAILPPSKNTFHGVGIVPTYEVKLSAELEANLENLDITTDTQLIKAVEVINSLKLK